MCGIIAYLGNTATALEVLIKGLKQLEYRGYDSAGIGIVRGDASDAGAAAAESDDEAGAGECKGDAGLFPQRRAKKAALTIVKRKGRVANLEAACASLGAGARLGVGHTRWATHGEPSDRNSHPHADASGELAVVHNGIVENYEELRRELQAEGVVFRSDTDSEVLAHLISAALREARRCAAVSAVFDPLEAAVRAALARVEGTYGLCVVSAARPNTLIGARRGSPLVLGVGEEECLLTSDAATVLDYTDQCVYLDDGDLVRIERHPASGTFSVALTDAAGRPAARPTRTLALKREDIERGGHKHFMIKEIMDQPRVLAECTRGRIDLDANDIALRGLAGAPWQRLRAARRLVICACGTSWHAGLVGGYLVEQLARMQCRVEYASEFRYKRPVLDGRDDVVLVISQSGETADTLAAVREAQAQGCLALGLVNTVGSTIARETDAGMYLHAGPEIGVASTKAFTAQVMCLAMIALKLGRDRGKQSDADFARRLRALAAIPAQIGATLAREAEGRQILRAAERFEGAESCLFLGRGFNFPVALEGALKLKECSYVHAEGYAAAEMKHGPIALIDERLPVVCVAPRSDATYSKNKSNIEEVHARKGRVIVVTDEGNRDFDERAECVLHVPRTEECFAPLLAVVPLQLLAYHVSDLRGLDVDRPRNLAKSVTVE